MSQSLEGGISGKKKKIKKIKEELKNCQSQNKRYLLIFQSLLIGDLRFEFITGICKPVFSDTSSIRSMQHKLNVYASCNCPYNESCDLQHVRLSDLFEHIIENICEYIS